MTEPGTSLLGKAVRSLLPFLTSGLTWSAGMKSYTGRSPAWGRAWGGHTGAALGAQLGGRVHCAGLGPRAARAPGSSDGPCLSVLTWLLSSPSYEVQLESKVRRKGLGKFLIQILQLMANR